MDGVSRFIQKVTIRNFLAYKELDVHSFDPNINLIIGTNGSGKTSFFTAIEFALTTNIRYNSQLFNKLANDQEIKELSVSIQLSNEYALTRKLLPLTENYLINEKPVNSAIYHHLIKYYFLDSSVLIPQGKIDQLVATTDKLCTELARFSARMNNVDELKALVKQILAKFDSVNEYRATLFSDLQAKQEDQLAMEKILNLRYEIKLIQTVMQARKIDSLKERIKRKKEKYAAIKKALSDVVEERTGKETELNQLRQEVEKEDVPANGLSQEECLKELTTKRVQLDLESEDCVNQLREKQEERSRLAEQLAAVKEEIERKLAILKERRPKLDELKEAEQALAKDVQVKRFEIDQLFSHAGQSADVQRSQTEQQIEELKKEISELKQHVDELTSRRDAAGELVRQLSADQVKNDEAIEKANQAITRLKTENLNCETLRRKLCAEMDKHKDSLNKHLDKKRNYYPLLGRSFLKGKENLDRVIELLRNGSDEEKQLVDGYYGLFIDIISFDKTFAIPIERTSKHYLHKHIVKDSNTVNRLLRKFDEMQFDGTCEFVALDLLKNKTIPLDNESSVYQPLLKYIRHEKKIERAVKHCFQRIYVCRSVEDVIHMQKDFTFVTLDGDVLLRNKSLNGGYIDKKRLWIENYTRYTIYEGFLAEASSKLDELAQNLSEYENKLGQNVIELDEHEQVKSQKHLDKYESRSKLSKNSVECEELERLIKQYRQVLKRKSGELENLQSRLELISDRPAINEAERLSRIGTIKTELEKLSVEHSRATANCNRAKLEVKSLKQNLRENLLKQETDLNDQLAQCEIEVTNLTAKSSNCQATIRIIESSIDQMRKKQGKKRSSSESSQSTTSQASSSASSKQRLEVLDKKRRICQLEAGIEQIAFKEIELKFNLKNVLQMQRTFEDEISLYQSQIEQFEDQAGKYLKTDNKTLHSKLTELEEELAEIGSQRTSIVSNNVHEQHYFYIYNHYTRHRELVNVAVQLQRREVTVERSLQTLSLFFMRFQQIFSWFRSQGKIQVEIKVPQEAIVGNTVSEKLSLSDIWSTLLVSFNGEVPRSLEFLSGGQRTTLSLCFLLTVLTLNPQPFLLIDETDQNLDEATCLRFGAILREHFSNRTQFFFSSNRTYFANFADKTFRVSRVDRNSSILSEVELDYVTSPENRSSQSIQIPELLSSQETVEDSGFERSSKRRKTGPWSGIF